MPAMFEMEELKVGLGGGKEKRIGSGIRAIGMMDGEGSCGESDALKLYAFIADH